MQATRTLSIKPWMKRLALAFGVLLLVLAAAAAWLVASFDANRYRGLLVEWMRDHKQRTLVIDGPVGLSVFPRLEVTLREVTLSEHQRSDEFLHLEEAALAVRVMPLLRKQLVVDRLSARGVRLNYTRDAQGRRNIDDLLKPADDKAPQDPPDAGPPPQFDVQAVELSDVRVRLADVPARLRGEVELGSLSLGRLADRTESPLKLEARLALQEPALEGQLQAESLLKLDLASGSVDLREARLGFQGHAFGLRELDTRLSGSLAYQGGHGALRAEGLTLEARAMLGALKLEPSTLSVGRFAYEPQARSLSIEQLALQARAVRDKQPIAAALQWPQLQVQGQALQGSALTGELSLGGAQPWKANFRSAAPSGNFDRVRLPGFEAVLSSSGTRQVSGTVRADLAIEPAKAALTLDALKVQARLQDPALKPLAVDLEGRAAGSTQAASWQLGGALNDNRFNTEGQALFAGTVTTLKARGEFNSLDLNTLLAEPPPAPAGRGSTSGPASHPVPTDTPVDLSPLRRLQGSLSLKAGRLAWRPYQLHDARVEATLDGGMLRVSTLAGRIWGGSIDASAFADARAQRVLLKGSGENIDIQAALRDVAQKDLLEGKGRISLDLEATGKSVNEMKSRLAGQAALQLRDGALKGINLARTLREAKAALAMRQDRMQQARETEKTDFSELNASFRIADGVARNEDLDLKSPFLRLGGEGDIDIGRSRIDYLARASIANTSKGQGGDELAALRGLTVPVHLSGALESPGWQVQWSAVAAQAAETAVKDRLEEKLKDKLGIKTPASATAPGAAASAPGPSRETREAAREKLKEQLLKGILK
ncbi:AsmA family protein [Aquabacterium sp. A7-Y]|uniref:AsmA family protein n=1 Tax=Aquabacterium sp. A7-Y TaxID=1349605 RepID=UPI00223CB70A|nr:AsmA family protein [Aquabacterium sp. A7-Y]MCW7537063.1 AsmA family protein [Aquabacterium sp. A7-Y]